MKRIFIAALCVLAATTLFAQPQKPSEEQRKKDFERIKSEKIAFITSELDLTPEEGFEFAVGWSGAWRMSCEVEPARGGTPDRITTVGFQNAAPDWGTNGLIACQSLQGGKFQIAIVDPKTRTSRVVTDHQAAYEDPSWAPDGRHIACSRAVRYDYAICLLDTMGDPPVILTQSGDWRTPAWQH